MDISDNIAQKINLNKCYICNKNLSLFFFNCKCEKNFCLKHQLPELHNCSFNFKELGKDKLKLDNPLINAEKVKSF